MASGALRELRELREVWDTTKMISEVASESTLAMDRNNNDYDLDYDALFGGRDFSCCDVDGRGGPR